MENKNFLNPLSRRRFLRNVVVASTGAAVMPNLLTSCNTDPDFVPEDGFGFFEGVASFDPSQSGVILWTRYTPAPNETETPVLMLDVATDDAFGTLVASESVQVDAASDHTVYVDVSGLSSNTAYYYRFRSELTGAVTVIGQTKTLPAQGEATQVSMAVVSCANFQAGLFNVYGAVADSEADVVVHLGDYIYEYEAGGYGTNDSTATLGREHLPADEIISLDDYRERYRQYRSDEQLQRAHQLKPFICVWDDHEVTNDAWTDGAQNHNDGEGDWETRKANAIQVWHEYLPARVTDNTKIYRSFDFGGLANLLMLDTRIIGRNEQLNYANYFNLDGSVNTAAFLADWQNPARTLLGAEQLAWLSGELAASGARWNVLGSQVLMGKYNIPLELLTVTALIAGGDTSDATLALYNTTVTELVTIKSRLLAGDTTVTAEERARVETVLPYNLDAWDGYPVEREAVFAAAGGKSLIALAGDTHNAWYAQLTDVGGNKVGAEFATASVSSPGFEGIFGNDPTVIGGFEQSNQLLIDDLQYADASQRGYLLASFSQGAAEADWRFVGSLATLNPTAVTGKTAVES